MAPEKTLSDESQMKQVLKMESTQYALGTVDWSEKEFFFAEGIEEKQDESEQMYLMCLCGAANKGKIFLLL